MFRAILLDDTLFDVDVGIVDNVSVDNFPVNDENPVMSALQPIQ